MYDKDNLIGWDRGNNLLSLDIIMSDDYSLYVKDGNGMVLWTGIVDIVDSAIDDIVFYQDSRDRSRHQDLVVLGERLLSEKEIIRDNGIYWNEYSNEIPYYNENLVVDNTDDILRKLMYGLK